MTGGNVIISAKGVYRANQFPFYVLVDSISKSKNHLTAGYTADKLATECRRGVFR